MTAERQVKVGSYQRDDGTNVRGYTQRRDSADAKEKWDTRKWQAAAGGASALVALAELIVGVSEILFAITMLILVGLNWLLAKAANPKPKTTRRRPPTRRRVIRRQTRRVVRRR